MKVKICSCRFFLVLHCNVSAEIIHKVEKQPVTLRCSHSVEGKVTWSREINGNKVHILTIDGDRETRYNDSGRQYGSLTDKSLTIRRAKVQDSGKYFCNNEPVELKVNSEDRNTSSTTSSAAVKTSASATSPSQTNAAPHTGTRLLHHRPCHHHHRLYCTKRRRLKRRGDGGQEDEDIYHVYDEIREEIRCQPTNATATYCTATFPGGSNQIEPDDSTMWETSGNNSEIEFDSSESPGSFIDDPALDEDIKGSSKLSDNTYVLLEKPHHLESTLSRVCSCSSTLSSCKNRCF
ncbi:uncharacterized protein LOC113153578 [Anabas testudineus]|uniref:uncharacterized protein LOC113153578 n=1 Tax=Anabas testudineus TaxID=64144 RepID=UPI000E45BF9C|nr:uncharacterized protein LOC113153578 [Anabas testudineus]